MRVVIVIVTFLTIQFSSFRYHGVSAVSTSTSASVAGFQVTPDPTKKYKEAIEKSTGHEMNQLLNPDATLPPPTASTSSSPAFTIVDDPSFSPHIPWENVLPSFYSSNDRSSGSSSSSSSSSSSTLFPRLSEIVQTKNPIPVSRRQFVPRKKFGIDDEHCTEYWFNNKIHTFGNTGFFGGFHAGVAPFATWLIDEKAYNGVTVRDIIAQDLRKVVNTANAHVIDLCCGVGMSTRALATAFQDATFVGGIDTSPEMISMARFISKYQVTYLALRASALSSKNEMMAFVMRLMAEVKSTLILTEDVVKYRASKVVEDLPEQFVEGGELKLPKVPLYAIGNAERINAPSKKFDLVTVMYAFHEIPFHARYRILRETRRLLKPGGKLAIVDIHPREYSPSPTMLAGEPYVLEYQKNIEKQIQQIQGFSSVQTRDVVPGHVTMWLLTRQD